MKIFLVGGAVRDALLGIPIKDRDWVVVGATPQQLTEQGYLPVGRDFPVFLHPQTREEYALARTERKTGPGYRGFVVHAAPEVTLDEDLARRDLTINAMALPLDKIHPDVPLAPQDLVDPFHGQRDLQDHVLRHVTPAFREDPVRILRIARFAARLPAFTVASETLHLMQDMVHSGEVDHLVPERVWQELALGLMAQKPSQMIKLLRLCGALKRLFPELEVDEALLGSLDMAADRDFALPVRFACLGLNHPVDRWKCVRPNADSLDLASLLTRAHIALQDTSGTPEAQVELLMHCDAFRKPTRFEQLLQAWICTRKASESAQAAVGLWTAYLAAAQSVATNLIAVGAMESGANGKNVGEAIRQARVEAVRKSRVMR